METSGHFSIIFHVLCFDIGFYEQLRKKKNHDDKAKENERIPQHKILSIDCFNIDILVLSS